DLVLAGDLCQSVGGLTRNLERLTREQGEGLLGSRLGPARQGARPDGRRVGGGEGLGEDEQLGAGAGCLSSAAAEPLDRRVAGSAWTQATVTGAFIAPLWPVSAARRLLNTGAKRA